jgi:hypothetical protein
MRLFERLAATNDWWARERGRSTLGFSQERTKERKKNEKPAY